MSKRSDPAAFARAAGAADPAPLAELAPAPDRARQPDLAPESAKALAVQDDDGAPPREYDPADYRWVPVRRRPRLDGWTEEKQRRFIETLADTGLVNVAARAVGMSRASAYQLRRSPHGAAFARAWDAARHHAGGLIEDIAFERAIEGTEQEVLNAEGDVIATRLVHDNRLLKISAQPPEARTLWWRPDTRRRAPADRRARPGRPSPRDGARSARAARTAARSRDPGA